MSETLEQIALRVAEEVKGKHGDLNIQIVEFSRRLVAALGAQEPKENWLPVKGYEGLYDISDLGNLRNAATKKVLAKSLMGMGYVKADLWRLGERKQTSVHRLVAEAFIGDLADLQVNHKNGIKTDNRLENLEVITESENRIHNYYTLGNQVRPVVATNITTGERRFYKSICQAERDGFHDSGIRACINGNSKSHNGHRWEDAAPVVKEGWQMVPKEPTPEMVNASWNAAGSVRFVDGQEKYIAVAYQAMLAAAPEYGK